jgi:hypothetical protein
MLAPMLLSVKSTKNENLSTYFWSADVLPRVTNSTSLYTANLVDAFVPCSLDEILKRQDTRRTSWELFHALSTRALYVGDKHLNVPVSTEASFLLCLADMQSSGVTVVGFLDRTIEGGKLSENRNNTWRLVLYLLLLDEAAVSTDAVDNSDFRSIGELIV